MRQSNVVETGDYVRIAAAGNAEGISKGPTDLLGVICSSGTSPTIAVFDGSTVSAPAAISTIALPVGFTPMPIRLKSGLSVTVGGTSPIVTLVYETA